MSDGAERLLQAMLTDCKDSGRTSFDWYFYKDYPEAAVGQKSKREPRENPPGGAGRAA